VRYQSEQFATGGLFVAVSLLLTACTVGPKYQRPSVQSPLPIYKEAGDWKPAQPNELSLGGKWWEIFGDPQLNVLEEKINVSNQNLKTAEAQFREARAALRYARADYYPTITASPSATRNRVSANRPPNNSVFNGITTNDFVLPFDLAYQADVWGRVRRNVESFRELAQASAADLATINLSLHADLAVDYFQARSLDAQEKLLLFTVSQYEEYLQLTENRFNGGLASEVEVQQARTLRP
jgi:outer membrane protein TolC